MLQKSEIGKLPRVFLVILAVILLFTFADFLAHSLSADFAVPSRYFPNKIIYGTIYGFFIYLLVRKQKPFMKSLLFSLALDIILQARYFIEGYPFGFVFLFLLIHFLILVPISWALFRKFNM